MSHRLQPYPEYKDSGLPWLGEIPAHWPTMRIKNILRETEERSGDGSGKLLSLTRAHGLLPQAEATKRLASAEDLSKYKVCKSGQLVMNRMQAWSGMFAMATLEGLVSPDYSVFKIGACANVEFCGYVFKTPLYVHQFAQWSKGIGTGFNRLYTPEFGAIPLGLPPLAEQAAIAAFLTHFDRRINRLLRCKRRLIELLDEQKQAIIHHAVTRGLDPNVRLKPSGIDWLGDVPEHWEVKRLRNIIIGRLTYGANAAAEFSDEDWPRYLRITDFGSDGRLRQDTFRSLPPMIAEGYRVEAGDLLLARSGATVGKTFLVQPDTGPACHAGYLIRARPNRSVVRPEYLFTFTQSRVFAEWKDRTFIIATIQNLSADKYANLPIVLPPLDEQSRILDSLDRELQPDNAVVDRAYREINVLREYRTRLIADVVTGKLDVRDVELPTFEADGEPDEFDAGEEAAEQPDEGQ
jgi:type I restriction enzyme, S subunit